MNILSIQSWVCFGHVGNAAAVFPLQRLGAEVWAVNTVQFSNHPGYGSRTGEVFAGAAIRALVDGIEARGVLGGCDALLSGYLGSPDTGEAVLHAVDRVRAANPAALYCCDPVFGDDGPGRYVAPGIFELLRDRAVAQADVLTPNRFELAALTGRTVDDIPQALTAVAELQAAMRIGGPRTVLVTSLPGDDLAIALLAADSTGAWQLRTPRLPASFNGAGDALAALFLFHLLQSGSAAEALELAASGLFGVLSHTVNSGQRELQLVAAQDQLVAPTQRFHVDGVTKSSRAARPDITHG